MIAPLETLTVEIDSDVLAQAEKVCADIGITLQDAAANAVSNLKSAEIEMDWIPASSFNAAKQRS